MAEEEIKKEAVKEEKSSALQMLKNSVSEEDNNPTTQLSLKTILGGDILNAELFRRQL